MPTTINVVFPAWSPVCSNIRHGFLKERRERFVKRCRYDGMRVAAADPFVSEKGEDEAGGGHSLIDCVFPAWIPM